MVYLRRRLIEPRAPGDVARIAGTGIPGNDGALIARDDHCVRITWVYPRLMMVVAARRSTNDHPRFSAVPRAVDRDVRHIDSIGVRRIDGDLLELPASSPERRVVGEASPGDACIIRSEESTLAGRGARWPRSRRRGLRRRSPQRWLYLGRSLGHKAVYDCIDTIRIRRGDCDAGSPDSLLRQSVCELCPGAAAVCGLEDSAARTVRRSIREPGRTSRVPEARVNDLGVRRIDDNLDRADVLVTEDFLPGPPAISGAEDSAFLVRRVEFPDGGDEYVVRILRIDRDLANVMCLVEPEVRPAFSSVRRFVDSVAETDGISQRRLTAADVDRIG